MTRFTLLALFSLLLISCGDTEETSTTENNFEGDIPQPVSTKISLAGSDQPDIVRYLKVQGSYSPALSPDGEWVAYRSRLTGEPQLWVTETAQLSAPQQITYGNSVTFHTWRPGHDEILYATDKEGNEREGYYLVNRDGTQERELLAPSDAFRFFGNFNKDGSKFTYSTTERNGTDFDIHIYDIELGTDKKVYNGKLGYYPISFSPDGEKIIISESVGEDANNLYLLQVQDSTLQRISKEEDPSEYSSIRWKADSSGFYLLTNAGGEFTGIAEFQLAEEQLTYLKQEEYDIEQLLFDDDKNQLHYVTNEGGFSNHHVLSLDGGSTPAIPEWPKGILSLRLAENGTTLVAGVGSPKIPGELYAGKIGSTEVWPITRAQTAGLNMDEMVSPEAHSFTARDGLTIHGLLYAPENMDENTPLVLGVHGGPTAQARPGFGALTQYLVARGFAYFDLNFRGSTGYGKSYARENNLRKREAELYDMEDAVKYLSEKGIVNADKVAVMGGSYGGYLTMAAMTRLPETFACGVAFVGVSNWVTALEGASPALKASDRLEYGDIEDPEDREFFKKMSPITYIDQVKNPVMVLHGANDPRDPVTESDEFVQGIRDNGGEVEYLRFPDEGHGIRKMKNRVTAYVRVAEFLEKHLMD